MIQHSVSLLWPLPSLHLEEAIRFSATVSRVAFGTRGTAVLDQLRDLTAGDPFGIYVYFVASDADIEEEPLRISCRATYLETVTASNGGHPEGMRFRPPSAVIAPLPGGTHWREFVHVCSFEELDTDGGIPLNEFCEWSRDGNFNVCSVPKGPRIVRRSISGSIGSRDDCSGQ